MERLSAVLFSVALGTLALLSLEGQRRIGRCLGWMAWILRLGSARTTLINLRLCFPNLDDDALRRLARQSLEHTGMLAAELAAVYRWPEQRWAKLTVATEGVELVDAARADGRGVLVLVPHFGNWEHLALALGRYRVTALYDPPRIRSLDPLIRQARNRAGARLVPIDAGGLKAFYRSLATGGVVALLPDQVPDRNAGVYADFFGVPALTMTLAHRLLVRTDAAVMIGAAIRCPGGFRVRFAAVDPALRDPDPVRSASALNTAIETLIAVDPAQYQWEYKRFKGRRRGTLDPYACR